MKITHFCVKFVFFSLKKKQKLLHKLSSFVSFNYIIIPNTVTSPIDTEMCCSLL